MNNIFSKIAICLFCVVAVLSSCKKDNMTKVEKDCYDFGTPKGDVGYQYIYNELSFSAPCYNPNNSDEFLYVKEYRDSDIFNEIWIRNLSTGEDRFLVRYVWQHPDWGENDWILFNHADNQVWKIKSDGDSLIQLTFQGLNTAARWKPDCTKIIYSENGSSDYYTIIANSEGVILDTLPGVYFTDGDWSDDNLIAASLNAGGIDIYDIDNSTFLRIEDGFFEVSNMGMTWSPDSRKLLWCTSDEVKITDMFENKSIHIRTSCDSRRYLRPSISPIGNKILIERIDATFNGYATVNSKRTIVMMDIDGENEQTILTN